MAPNLSKTQIAILALITATIAWYGLATAIVSAQVSQTQSVTRKLVSAPPPEYPPLAVKMNIHGIARVMATIEPDGRVTRVKELGGNPVLLTSLVDAVKKWRYSPADHESEIEITFQFKPSR
jgi:protein TonB